MTEHATRREALKYSGMIAAGGVLAGCTVSESGDSTAGEGEYSVSMVPVGELSFEEVPSDVMVYSLLYADMAVAYGHGDAVNSLGFDAASGGNTLSAYYDRLDGVSFEQDDLTQLNTGSGNISVDEELFYELDSDLHLVDPCLVRSFDGWDESDITEIRENIAPWFGNVYSRSHSEPPDGCRQAYEYYTLWEIAERVATVFRASDRYEELASIRQEMVRQIESERPPESERPTVGAVIFMNDTFYPSRIDTPGFSNAHVRPLGAEDAFAGDDVTYESSYDYETMLEIDPDVILHQYGIASYYDVGSITEQLAEHPVASELSAVENGRVYPSAHPVQGPLMNLFQLEMTAKQLYPEQFGEWPGYTHGEPYPEMPEGERLFDRDRVAEIVAGEI
ncbi:ABC transporter substrate-binding protein [Halovenus sp. WSH3]|uniref:ABC transporter substrate-binding protein n=1 Tax=Halovenus carboxidivorans TaxID=2692199 RepID=A0A6B0TFB2_9EURY|nr:ABC transporter substrate-binding protein [Halovenus carboxidivorans]MXR51879.1 ABC transporter substrate-binding protein [Halovenus carboxidivorans]